MKEKAMYDFLSSPAKVAVVTSLLFAPAPLLAGSYGESAVRDGRVGNATAGATVPCPRLGQNIPKNLAAQMDCGVAKPRVAGERVRNRGGLATILDRFPHKRTTPPANNDDDNPNRTDNPRVVVLEDGDLTPTGNTDTPTPTTDEDTTPPTTVSSGPTSKWDRLAELGTSYEDVKNQSQSFQDQFRDYFNENGSLGDWSGFNPTE